MSDSNTDSTGGKSEIDNDTTQCIPPKCVSSDAENQHESVFASIREPSNANAGTNEEESNECLQDDQTSDPDRNDSIDDGRLLFDYAIIYKDLLSEGKWGRRPTENGNCKILITGITSEGIDSKQIQDSLVTSEYLHSSFTYKIIIGNSDSVIDRAIERCVQSMLVGEQSQFSLKFLSITIPTVVSDCADCSISIQCIIELQDLTNDAPIYDWDEEKMFKQAMYHKTKGVGLFKDGRHVEAFLRFSKSFKILNCVDVRSRKDKMACDFNSLRVALYNNMAFCQLHFKNNVHAITLSSKALTVEPNNVKSLYRRALAYTNVKKFEEAKQDLKKILLVEPCNIAAKNKLDELKEIMKENDAAYTTIMKKMFSS